MDADHRFATSAWVSLIPRLRALRQGPIAMDERRGALTVPQNQALAELEGAVTSYFAADRDKSLFMLRADEGAIYKVRRCSARMCHAACYWRDRMPHPTLAGEAWGLPLPVCT